MVTTNVQSAPTVTPLQSPSPHTHTPPALPFVVAYISCAMLTKTAALKLESEPKCNLIMNADNPWESMYVCSGLNITVYLCHRNWLLHSDNKIPTQPLNFTPQEVPCFSKPSNPESAGAGAGFCSNQAVTHPPHHSHIVTPTTNKSTAERGATKFGFMLLLLVAVVAAS